MDVESNAFGDTMSFINIGNAAALHNNQLNLTKPQPLSQVPEPLRASLDYLQFNGPNPSAAQATSHRHTPTIPASANLTTESAFDFKENTGNTGFGGGDVYPNADLAGIEGLTYVDEEQKLWNEITNDAVWLQSLGGLQGNKPESSVALNDDFMNSLREARLQKEMENAMNGNSSTNGYAGGYSDIINLEFQRDLF